MMELINCTLTDVSGASTQAQAQLATLSAGERFGRGMKRAAIVFGASLVFLPVPGLHWIPAAGIFVAAYYFFKVFHEPTLIREAKGECPACKQTITLAGPINAIESKEICPNCRTLLKIHPTNLRVVSGQPT